MISRLAPTPSGYLHWGNLYNFAETWSAVRRAGGTLWLRIDDVDASRYRRDYVIDLFETLTWLGFDWDQGPRSVADFEKNFSQSLRTDEYRNLLTRVPTYACRCSRKEIADRAVQAGQRLNPRSSYDGHCRNLKIPFIAGESSLRALHNDVVVWTRENRPAYHWVSVCDDIRIGTTHLIRGEDLQLSSEIQLELATAAGWPEYATIQHRFHVLLKDSKGMKFSKTADSESLRAWRLEGRSSSEVWQALSQKVKRPEIVSDLRAW